MLCSKLYTRVHVQEVVHMLPSLCRGSKCPPAVPKRDPDTRLSSTSSSSESSVISLQVIDDCSLARIWFITIPLMHRSAQEFRFHFRCLMGIAGELSYGDRHINRMGSPRTFSSSRAA